MRNIIEIKWIIFIIIYYCINFGFIQILNRWLTLWHPLNARKLSPSISLIMKVKISTVFFAIRLKWLILAFIVYHPTRKIFTGVFSLGWIFFVCLGFIVPVDGNFTITVKRMQMQILGIHGHWAVRDL